MGKPETLDMETGIEDGEQKKGAGTLAGYKREVFPQFDCGVSKRGRWKHHQRGMGK